MLYIITGVVVGVVILAALFLVGLRVYCHHRTHTGNYNVY